jgi:hypothetical protein
MKYTVFLSYSSKDMNLVNSIRNELERAGINVYLAEEDLQLGKSLPEKIIRNIISANCMVVLLTDTGIRSQFVNQEIGVASANNKLIIPMVEKKVKNKVKGLLEGRELIIFDKHKRDNAIGRVRSYISDIKLTIELKMEEREELLIFLAAVAFIVLFAIILYFASRRK